jgi:hypothetical protein
MEEANIKSLLARFTRITFVFTLLLRQCLATLQNNRDESTGI